MKKVIAGLAIMLGVLAAPGVASATGDDGWSCPAGTTFDYKIDNLSGETFTVPTPPSGWTITGVVLKASTEHLLVSPVTPGQVINVKALMGHDVSHVHVCKAQYQETTTTTTTLPDEETTTTTTVPEEETTTTTICVDCTPNTNVTIPTTTIADEESTTTTSTVALTDPPVPSTTLIRNPLAPFDPSPTTTVPKMTALPVTGSDEAARIAPWALIVLCLGGIAAITARRKHEENSL